MFTVLLWALMALCIYIVLNCNVYLPCTIRGRGVRAIISLVILFLTTGWSVGLIEYVGSQRRRKSGVYLEGNATFF